MFYLLNDMALTSLTVLAAPYPSAQLHSNSSNHNRTRKAGSWPASLLPPPPQLHSRVAEVLVEVVESSKLLDAAEAEEVD